MNRSIALLLPVSAALMVSSARPASAALSDADEASLRQWITKGNSMMVHKQYEEAISDYEEALKLDPGNSIAKLNIAETYNNWGIKFYSQRKFAEAIAQWQHCLQLNPNHTKARRNIDIAQQAAARQRAEVNATESRHAPGYEEERVAPPIEDRPDDRDTSSQAPSHAPSKYGSLSVKGESTVNHKPTPIGKYASEKKDQPVSDTFSAMDKDVDTNAADKAQTPGEIRAGVSDVSAGVVLKKQPGNSNGAGGRTPTRSAGARADTVPLSNSPLPPLNAVAPVVNVNPAPDATPPAHTSLPSLNAVAPVVPVTNTSSTAAPVAPAAAAPQMPRRTNATYPVLPSQFLNQTQAAPVRGQILPTQYGMGIAPNAVLPSDSVGTPSGVTSRADSGAAPAATSLDDQLGAIEMKVYGHKQADMTVLQRLEKMEMDATKQTQTGTIVDRINLLRHNFGF